MRKSLFLPASICCVLMAALFSACPDLSGSGAGPKLVESVTFGESVISLAAGETRQLSAAVEPQDAENKALSWASTIPAFATVSDSGLVTAVAEGATIVTATTRDGSGKFASCMVTVTGVAVKVSSITVSSPSPTLERGSTLQLSAAVEPADATNKTVTWSSSNQVVATVDSGGLVTGIVPSNTPVTITAAATDGSGVSGSVDITVTLPAGYNEGTSITATTDPSSIPSPFYIGDTFTINTSLLPSNATDTGVSWSVSPAGIVSLSSTTGPSITVSGVAAGAATITATSGGKTATCAVTVTAGSGLAITFAGFGDETVDLSPNYLYDLSRRANNEQLTVPVNGTYNSITWYVDGQQRYGDSSYIIISAGGHSVGVHYLTAVVRTTDSPPKYFSKELSFRVVE